MRALFRKRNFVLLWSAQALARLAETLFSAGVMVAVFNETGSAVQTAAVMLAHLLPNFILSPFAGVVVDRLPRKLVMLAATGLNVALIAALWGVLGQVMLPLFWLYVVKVGMAAATSFYEPARMSIIPSIIEKGLLIRANSMIIGTNQIAVATGYIVGGWLALSLELVWITAFVLIGYTIALILLIPIKAEAQVKTSNEAETESIKDSILAGIQVMRKNPVARPLIVMELLEHIPHGMWTSALMLVFVTQALGSGSDQWGLHNGAFFVGQIMGALTATMAAKFVARWAGWTIIVDTFFNAALTVMYALSPTNFIAILVSFLFGPPYAIRDVAQDTLLQTSVDKSLLGRVYAMRDMLRNMVFMLSGIGFAALADVLPIRWIFLIGAGLYALTALYAMMNRALRQSKIEA
jgi:hypothetical protein